MASLTNLKKTNDTLTMNINNVDVSFPNALRRIILSEVETVAFNTDEYLNSDLKILHNTTPLHNEFILHRLGLIPINITNTDEFNSSKYKFIINKENTSNSIINVTTQDFEVYDTETNTQLETEDFFPRDPLTNEHILLLKLKPSISLGKPGEKIHIEGKASKSTGNKNARFSPACCVLHTYVFDEEKFKSAIKEKNITNIEQFRIEEGERYFKTNENDEPSEFNFTIESVGIYQPEIILKNSLNVLAKKLLDFKNNVSNIIEENSVIETIKIYPSLEKMKAITIEVTDETHTLGNLVQSYLSLHPDVEFCAYKNPHPLINKIQFKIKVKDNEMGTLNRALKDTINVLIDTINNFSKVNNDKFKIKAN